MSDNDYRRGKASRRNGKRCISLSELGTTAQILLCVQHFLYTHTSNDDTNAFDYLRECSLLPGTIYFWVISFFLNLSLAGCVAPEICLDITAGAGRSCLLRKENFPDGKHILPGLPSLHWLPGLMSSLSHI